MRRDCWGGPARLFGCVLVAGLLSCRSTSPLDLMALGGPIIPGAEYVGMEACADCHEEEAKRYPLTSHFGTSITGGEITKGERCESCHGAGSRHVESRGDPSMISRGGAERCFVCHPDTRGEFQLQYHHPVPEGRITCAACHDPHGSVAADLVARPGDRCAACHKEQKGPFLFEHDPMRDGCEACHQPHGSVFEKLLVADGRVLCLRCHWEPAVNTVPGRIGSFSHGAGGPNFHIGRGSDCVDCHTMPHGSNIDHALEQ